MLDSKGSTVLERFKQGDCQAAGMLLNRLRPYIRTIVRTARGNRSVRIADESDLVQEVILQGIRGAATFHGNNMGQLVRWVRTMAIRTSQKPLNKGTGREAVVCIEDVDENMVEDSSLGPDRKAVLQENSALMAVALSRIPEEMRDVLMWRLVDGLSHAEISERMNRSPGAIRMLFLRSLERLREAYGEEEMSRWE